MSMVPSLNKQKSSGCWWTDDLGSFARVLKCLSASASLCVKNGTLKVSMVASWIEKMCFFIFCFFLGRVALVDASHLETLVCDWLSDWFELCQGREKNLSSSLPLQSGARLYPRLGQLAVCLWHFVHCLRWGLPRFAWSIPREYSRDSFFYNTKWDIRLLFVVLIRRFFVFRFSNIFV